MRVQKKSIRIKVELDVVIVSGGGGRSFGGSNLKVLKVLAATQ